MFSNLEYITFSLCLNKRDIFYERAISIKQLWLEIIEKIGCSKSVSIYNMYHIYVYVSYMDWLWAPFFLNYFEPELFYRNVPFIKKCFFCWDTKKLIYSKLVSNPFKYWNINKLWLQSKRMYIKKNNKIMLWISCFFIKISFQFLQTF